MRRLLPLLFFVAACATTTQIEPPDVPDWESVPAGVTAAFCQRLQMDGIGANGAEVSLVKVTQPIASPAALANLGKPKRRVAIVHRALPIATMTGGPTSCAWKQIDAIDPSRQHDSMVVELSAPVPNPARPSAGIVARVTLGGTHPNWYWIELLPRPQGWTIGRIFPISL